MDKESKVQTWRDLKSDKPKAVPLRSRFRAFKRICKTIFYLAIFAGLAFGAFKAYESGIIQQAITPTTEDLKQVAFKTDGKITNAWLLQNDCIPPVQNLANIDIDALQKKFESYAQIKRVDIEKIYPDKMSIKINERIPVGRVALNKASKIEFYLLANDGTFFEPHCYEEELLQKLPWIVGLNIRTKDDKILPYSQAKVVENFLLDAQLNISAPFFNQWEIVNVSELESITLPIFMVTSKSGLKIIFSSKDLNFQFKKLEYMLKFFEEDDLLNIEKIDLSMRLLGIATEKKSDE